MAGEKRDPDSRRAYDRRSAGLRCSFCGKHQDECGKIIAGPGVYICDECCVLCMSILTEEGIPADTSGTRPDCRLAVRGADGAVSCWEFGPPPDERHGTMAFAQCHACGTWNFGLYPLDAVNACLRCGADLGPRSFRGLAMGDGRFTERARRVLVASQEAAGREGAAATGARHLLVALLRQDEGSPARRVLHEIGVDTDALAQTLAGEPSRQGTHRANPPFSSVAGEVVRRDAPAHARVLGHEHIGPEHLLLALCQNPDTGPLLERAGVTQENLVHGLRGQAGTAGV